MSPRDFLGQFNVSSDLQYTVGILLLDDMEGANNWVPGGNAGDYAVGHDQAAAFFGTQGLKVTTRVTGPAEDDNVTAQRQLPFPNNDLLVIRAKLGIPDFSVLKYLRVVMTMFRAGRSRNGGIEFRPNTPDLRYMNSGATWTTLAGYDAGMTDGQWYNFQLQMDLATRKYISVEFNGIKTPLTADFYDAEDLLGKRFCQITFSGSTTGAAAASIYVDSVYAGTYLDI